MFYAIITTDFLLAATNARSNQLLSFVRPNAFNFQMTVNMLTQSLLYQIVR